MSILSLGATRFLWRSLCNGTTGLEIKEQEFTAASLAQTAGATFMKVTAIHRRTKRQNILNPL
jgi:hypothetical protein